MGEALQLQRLDRGFCCVDGQADLEFLHDIEQRHERRWRRHLVDAPVDKGLGLLYVGTGQNLDAPSGPLADSLLAIHYKTARSLVSIESTIPTP